MKHMITGLLAGLLLGVPTAVLAADSVPGQPTVTTTVRCPHVPGDRWASCPYRVTVRRTDQQPFEVRVGRWICRSKWIRAAGHYRASCTRGHR